MSKSERVNPYDLRSHRSHIAAIGAESNLIFLPIRGEPPRLRHQRSLGIIRWRRALQSQPHDERHKKHHRVNSHALDNSDVFGDLFGFLQLAVGGTAAYLYTLPLATVAPVAVPPFEVVIVDEYTFYIPRRLALTPSSYNR